MSSNNFLSDNKDNIRKGKEASKNQNKSKIIALYNLGISAQDIASQLKLRDVEVQQVLLTYKKNG